MIFKFSFIETSINPFGVAVFHTIYNIFTAFLLFPFAKFIEKLSIKYIPEGKEDTSNVILDERLIITPTFAISECYKKVIEMGEIVEFNFVYATKMLKSFHTKKAEQIVENETKIDNYEDK